MTLYQLAKVLRQRQHDQGHHPWSLLRKISDADMIADYSTCHVCGERLVTEADALAQSTTEDFIALIDARLAQHAPQHKQ